MVWVIGSLIILVVFSAAIVSATRRRPTDVIPPVVVPPAADDTLARRVRRLEDELDDVSAQLIAMRDDLQYLMRQLEDRG